MQTLPRKLLNGALVIGGFLIVFLGVYKFSNTNSSFLHVVDIGVAHADDPNCSDAGSGDADAGDGCGCGSVASDTGSSL